jgi:hypothetical protein
VLAFKQKNVRERVDRFSFRGTILMSATSGIGRDTERERGTRGNGNSMEGAFNSGLVRPVEKPAGFG